MADPLQITERQGVSLASISARRGASASDIGEAISITMPAGPHCTSSPAFDIIGTGPGTWLAFAADAPYGWGGALEQQLAGLASVSDQTGAYRIFRIEGPNARTLLQRGAAIGLDDAAFAPGTVAITVMAHIDVVIRRLDGADAFELAVFRSYAGSFLHWFDGAAAALRDSAIASPI